jgi:hypothetical protein
MTLTGGLWYGAATLRGMKAGIKALLLLLAALADVAFIVVLLRVRAVMGAYLGKIRDFNPASFAGGEFSGNFLGFLWRELGAKGEKVVVRTFSILLALAALGEHTGPLGRYVAIWRRSPSNSPFPG